MAVLVAVLFTVKAPAAPDAKGAAGGSPARVVHVLEPERTGLVSPAGLAFSTSSSSFHVVQARAGGTPDTEVVRLTPFAALPGSDRAGSARIAAALSDPVNMAFDERRKRLLMLDRANRLLEVGVDANGALDPRTLVPRDTLRLELSNSQGIAVDPATGVVFVLDAELPRILRIDPGRDGAFDPATISEVDLSSTGVRTPRGLAFDPANGHLHVAGRGSILELTVDGAFVATHDSSALPLSEPAGMVFAPSGDRTDAPGELSLYVADAGTSPSSGQIVELSLTPLASVEGDSFTPTVVNAVDMATLSPPSPDPSGIAYLPAPIDRLMVSDAEVEETAGGISHFQGTNVWELNRNGSVARTANISKIAPTEVPMTDEPTGTAFQSGTGHHFVTEDSGRKIYHLDPGSDGLIGTAGDTWTSFSTSIVGNTDPEGITYDSFSDRLFVADGLNREVYQYTTAGALVGQFDTHTYGVEDPETVEFNSVSGTLFVLSNIQSGPIIIETTTSGALLRTFDLSETPLDKPAGLAYAPASDGSGDMHFYIVDRGIDNNEAPELIDGKLYELTAPPPDPPANAPPTVAAGSDQATTVPTPAGLDGTVSDDGQPNPPGALTTIWTKQSGPGSVSFGNASAVDTTAAFSIPGTYVLRLTAADGALASFDQLTVSVSPDNPGSPFYFSLRDAATVGSVAAANEDVLYFDGASFSLYFDGSDVGIGSLRIDAFVRVDADTVLFSFDADKPVPGIPGIVDDSDLVRFEATSVGAATAGTFSLYFDGSDVGLSASGHDVTTVEPLSDGRIIVSILGSVTVSGASGNVSVRDEDLLVFTPTSLGDVTAGTFEMYFDGSDVGLGDAGEEVDAAALDSTGRIHLSAFATFSVPGVGGDDEDVFVFTPSTLGASTTGTYSPALFFDGSAFGLAANDVFAIDLP
jgi:hypothetical protein